MYADNLCFLCIGPPNTMIFSNLTEAIGVVVTAELSTVSPSL